MGIMGLNILVFSKIYWWGDLILDYGICMTKPVHQSVVSEFVFRNSRNRALNHYTIFINTRLGHKRAIIKTPTHQSYKYFILRFNSTYTELIQHIFYYFSPSASTFSRSNGYRLSGSRLFSSLLTVGRYLCDVFRDSSTN